MMQLTKSQQDQLLMQQKINASQGESIQELTARIQELLSQIAWLNRQLFGQKSEKLAHLDPNQLSLFENLASQVQEEARIEEARAEAVKAIEDHKVDKKAERRNRKMLEDLPVIGGLQSSNKQLINLFYTERSSSLRGWPFLVRIPKT